MTDGRTRIEDLTATLLGKDGLRVPCSLSVSATIIHDRDTAVIIARDITGRLRAEEHIRASLHEKEVMLKEIHHRVKNNLQIVSSLLSIQSKYLADPRDARLFVESQDRIRTMALVHEKLYQSSDLASIDFSPYIERLATNLFRSYGGGGRVNLSLDVGNVYLSVEKAVPCGLIVNELVMNALKYAFPGDRTGEIVVEVRQEGDRMSLAVSDDGVGLPPGFDITKSNTLGLQLVELLVSQLEGTLTIGPGPGTSFHISFKTGAPTSTTVSPTRVGPEPN
jgi:two-component sensor histidine kinase